MRFASWTSNDGRVGGLRCVVPLAVLAMGILSSCDGRRETREILYTPDMHFSMAVKAQEPDPLNPGQPAMRMPVEGTIPRHWTPYTIADEDADELASKLTNPLPRTTEVLKTGEKYYGVYCLPCHGPKGGGVGEVIRVNAGMPMPPSLYSDKVSVEWTDGRIFHVLTRGQGNMPSYASKMDAEKRWAVIHYVRALQRAARPTEEDLKIAEESQSRRPAAAGQSQ